MRVLIINKQAPFEGRGAEQVIWKIAKRLATEGHEVLFFTASPQKSESVPDIPGIEFEFVSTADEPTRGMIEFFVKGPTAYRGVYREFKPDLVYDNPSPFPFHFAHVYGDAPTVSKVHAIYRRLAFTCKEHPLVKLGTILGEETYRLARNEFFITNSESTAERLSSLVNTNRNEIVANPIGIDIDEFEFHVPTEVDQVVTISKLSPRKRVGDLLRAWESIEDEHPDATLTVAGSGPLKDDLHNLTAELGLESVRFPGFVSETRKRELLYEASVYVSPTLYEGFGISLLEAMASGCAVVASDTWGVKDYLIDGYNGRTVPPKTPSKLAGAIICLLSSSESCRKLSSAARETAAEYSMQESIDKELEYVENIV